MLRQLRDAIVQESLGSNAQKNRGPESLGHIIIKWTTALPYRGIYAIY
jgi:hypothetical protein